MWCTDTVSPVTAWLPHPPRLGIAQRRGIVRPVTVQIINVSEFDPSWNWLARRFASDNLVWKAYTTRVKTSSLSRLDRPLGRVAATLTTRRPIRKHAGRSVVVPHGLILAPYSECLARPAVSQALNLLFSSNFLHRSPPPARLDRC